MSLNHWKKLNSKIVAKNNYWSYCLDEFEIENGHKGEYHYVHTSGSTMVIPVTDKNKFLLVNQFRYLNNKESIEFPCGLIEQGLSAEENALKELREETGFSAKVLKKVAEFAPYTGAGDEICSVYIAQQLYENPLTGDATEEFELIEKSFDEIEALIDNNIIWDGLTLSAWILSQKHFIK